jgi:hypothetical protein
MPESRPARSLLDSALAAGALTTIATGGALIGLGMRDGEASRVFRLVGRGLLERAGVLSTAAPLTSVALGYAHHLLIACGWGTALGLLVLLPKSGSARALAALVASVAYAATALFVVPPILRIGYAVTSNASTVVPIAAALFLALVGEAWIDSAETP